MGPRSIVIALAPVLLAGYVLAATPDNFIGSRGTPEPHSSPQLLAQAQPGLTAEEQALLNQIQADSAKLKADEAAEAASGKPANPQIKYIRASLQHQGEAATALGHTTMHYHGHRAAALRAMAEAHSQLMDCYRIDKK